MSSPAASAAASTTLQHTEGPRMVLVRLVVSHTAFVAAFFVPVTAELLWATAIAYVVRVFAIEGGMHRYFSHRSYKTSRAFQAFLAMLAAAGGQRGPIWWAILHRDHHRYSDTDRDVHSPVAGSRLHAYFGWLLDQKTLDTDLTRAQDLSRYPELVWINKNHHLFPLLGIALVYAVGEFTALFGRTGLGWSAVLWVFFVSVVLGQHAPYLVNTFAHGVKAGFFHRRRFDTGADTSTNVWILALPTLGAGWHNNHHRYMNSARAGFYWYEVDLCYLILRMLALLRIVWDLHPVPQAVLDEGRHKPAELHADHA